MIGVGEEELEEEFDGGGGLIAFLDEDGGVVNAGVEELF